MARTWRIVAAALSGGIASSCAGDGIGPLHEDLVARFGLDPLPPLVHPADNPPNPARVELGRLLFFDPMQSAGKDVACATCHLPRFGMSDGRRLPAGPSGVGLGPDRRLTDPTMVLEARNSLTVINAGFNRFVDQVGPDGYLFWDGRRRRLENLVTLPQREFSEMRGDGFPLEHALDSVLARLRAIPAYVTRFEAAFPERPAGAAIDSTTLAQALAQFVRSLVGDQSPYDRFVAGEADALSLPQKRGLVLFHTKAGCVQCHGGPMLSDFNFHVVGARQEGPGFQTTPHEDFGRWNATKLEADRWKFRTPSLRNVAVTGPYTHAGAYATLREVVEFFDRGGGDHPGIPASRLDPVLRPLGLTGDEIDDLVAFLHALTHEPPVAVPTSLPSGLTPPR